jgi:hypothetical protein
LKETTELFKYLKSDQETFHDSLQENAKLQLIKTLAASANNARLAVTAAPGSNPKHPSELNVYSSESWKIKQRGPANTFLLTKKWIRGV